MCIHGLAPHPDYLLGVDCINNFNARGLTSAQWVEWRLYNKHYRTPMQRADINSALERSAAIAIHGGKPPKELMKLIPNYGKPETRITDEMMEQLEEWGIPPEARIG